MDVPEILERAAQILQERGHCKGALEDEEGRVCLEAAIITAIGGKVRANLDSFTAEQLGLWLDSCLALQKTGKTGTTSYPRPYQYNDSPDTTTEDVLNLLYTAKAMCK